MSGMAWRLRRAAVRLREERVEVQHLMEAHGPGGQGAMLMLLAAPCVLPVPGVGSVLGLGIAALAWAMWCGRESNGLPQRVARVTMPRIWARRVLAFLARVYAMSAVMSRPRLSHVASIGVRTWIPLLVAWMAVLIILPIPFGNVLPAIALILLGVGLVFLDGLLIVAAMAAAGLATAFPVALGVAAVVWGPEALGFLMPGS
ncbi:MAG: exopolysaccharide biosynthesis protein [Rubrivivax sp.]|nr:exopolysaccharide biosynthesis protein [Rubrivivax sp.]